MQQLTKTFAKGGIATAAVGALALAGATPAQARGDDDGISVGEVIAGAVIIGGIKRIGATAGRLVPAMCCIYLVGAGIVCTLHLDQIPGVLGLIVQDGMTGRAVLGGSVTAVIFRPSRKG